MLTQAIDIHSTVGGSKDAHWINLAMSFLTAYVEGRGHALLMSESDALSYVTAIVDALKTAVGGLDSGVISCAVPSALPGASGCTDHRIPRPHTS
jgi:hypothetical protein